MPAMGMHFSERKKLAIGMDFFFSKKKKHSKVKVTVHCLRDVDIN
jgi:hypothetical protein